MIKNQVIKIFQDGKICRDTPAVVLARRAGGVQVRFTPMLEDEEVTVWCVMRDRKGKYEANGWNYWILPKYSVYSGSVHDLVMEEDRKILSKMGI